MTQQTVSKQQQQHPFKNLHLAPDTQPCHYPTTSRKQSLIYSIFLPKAQKAENINALHTTSNTSMQKNI